MDPTAPRDETRPNFSPITGVPTKPE
jgi:hypothetical protein